MIFIQKKKIVIQISENFDYVVNRISVGFTTYELSEFTKIRSTYAKTMYRLLKQWRTVGKKRFNIEDYKRLMDMPEYYSPSEIDKNVLAPIKKELPDFFTNLKVKKIKSNTRGTPVIAYEFTWKPERTGDWVENKYKKRSKKRESLPNWATNPVKNDNTVSEESPKEMQEKLKKIRK